MARYFETKGIKSLEEKRGKANGLGKGRPRKAPEDPKEKIRRRSKDEVPIKLLKREKGEWRQ